MTTMNARPGSVCAKSLTESYSRSSPKTPTRTLLPCLPGPMPITGPLLSSSSSSIAEVSGVVVIDFLIVTDLFPLSTWMSTVAEAPSPSLIVAFSDGLAGALGAAGVAGGVGGRVSCAWTPGVRGATAMIKARRKAPPSTNRRTRRGGVLAAMSVAGCIGVLPEASNCPLDASRRPGGFKVVPGGPRGEDARGVRAIIPENARPTRKSGGMRRFAQFRRRAPGRWNLIQGHNRHRHLLDFETAPSPRGPPPGPHAALFLRGPFCNGGIACRAPAPQALAADEPVTLNFVNADIDAVIRAVAEITGRNFVVDPKVKGTINIVSARPVPRSLVYPTLLSALRLQGYRRHRGRRRGQDRA